MVDACGGHIDRLPAKKGEKEKICNGIFKINPEVLTSDKSKKDKIKKIVQNAN